MVIDPTIEFQRSSQFQLFFVDTIDQQPPAPDGSNLGNLNVSGSSAGYYGFMYVCANLVMTGTGNTQYAPNVYKPDGTRAFSSSESQDLGKVWLNGALNSAGYISVAGNPVIFGSVITERGITGSGSIDVYYDANLARGRALTVRTLPPSPSPSPSPLSPTPTPQPTVSLTPTPGPTVLPDPDPSTINGFPRRLSPLGDVTGDGKSDFAVSAEGRVYVFSSVTGEFIRIFSPVEPEPSFGSALAPIGNLNGNGRDELIIGAPSQTISPHPTASGRAFVVDAASGQQIRAFSSPNAMASGGFGTSVAALPDVNGDSSPDFLVGAPGDRVGFSFDRAGAAYLFSGATGALLRTLISPAEQLNGNFGYEIFVIGDDSGDGVGDIAVVASGERKLHIFESFTGSPIRSISMNSIATIRAFSDHDGDQHPDFLIGGSGYVWVMSGLDGSQLLTRYPPSPFAGAVTLVDDFNLDGIQDWLVGSLNEPPFGRAYLLSGASGSAIRTFHGQTYYGFGREAIQIGDIDEDQLPEIVITDSQSVKLFMSSLPQIVSLQISQYLLGSTDDPGGLDLDDNGAIDIGDLTIIHLN